MGQVKGTEIPRSISYIPWNTKSTTPKPQVTPSFKSTTDPLSNLIKQYAGVTVPQMSQLPGTSYESMQGMFDMGGSVDPFANPNMTIGNNTLYAGKWYSPGEIDALISGAGSAGGGGGGGGGGYGGGGYGGGSEGGGTVAPNIGWSEGYTVDNAPDWWRGLVPDTYDANSEYIALYNAMIPFMSPEDQRAAGKYLFGTIPKETSESWGTYNPETMSGINPPVNITTELTEQFTTSDRAKSALDTLTKLVQVSGRDEAKMGEGYTFLRNLLATIEDYGGGSVGGGERQTRAQYQQMQSAVDPLLSQASGGALSPFKAMASQVANPFFSAGNVVPIAKNQSGRYVFGNPNPEFYG